MGISVVSSVISGGNSPILSGGSAADAGLPVDFAALLGEQLLAASPNLLIENTDTQGLPTTEDPLLNPEQLAELASLDPSLAAQLGNPAIASQLLQAKQQNTEITTDPTVDRNISLISGAASNPLEQAGLQENANSLGDALLRDISAATGKTSLQGNSETANSGEGFAETLLKAGNKATETGSADKLLAATSPTSAMANASATPTAELAKNALADSANFAADLTKQPSAMLTAANNAMASSPSGSVQTNTAPSAEITTPLHDAQWSNNFSEKVVWMAKNEHQTAQININPPELGPMQIRLSLNGDQATAVFASQHVEVRQAIEEAMPRLREMLSSSGISLGEANVGAQLPQQNRENAPQFANTKSNETRLTSENAILAGDMNAKNSAGSIPIQRGRGLVDLFA